MNLFKIISDLEKVEPEALERINSRRDIFGALASMGKKTALAAAPIAIGSIFNKAFAGTQDAVAVFKYALLLEYLEEDFYAQALAKTGLVPTGAPLGAIQQIKKHESAHVVLIETALGAAHNSMRPAKGFNFGTAFDSYTNFLATAQSLEDGGVRAYKGKATELQANNITIAAANSDALTIALQIHSVEARHAAHIRQMRRALGGTAANQAAWITNAEANGAVAAIYGAGTPATTFPSEANTSQGGLNLATVLTGYSAADISEAFDEGLDEATVKSIVGPFVVV